MSLRSCLITGANGLIGSHLADLAVQKGVTVFGTVRGATQNVDHLAGKLRLLDCEFSRSEDVAAAVRESQPDNVFHLAAQSLRGAAWQDAAGTIAVNVLGTVHLLETAVKAGLDPTVVVAGSSAGYGAGASDGRAMAEDTPLLPDDLYGITKAVVDLLGRAYWKTYLLRVVRARPFFIIGPRKTGDVSSDFARGIVAVERGRASALRVGNLEAVRDFVDVRDAARALWLLAEKGAPGEAYNICAGEGHTVQELLDVMLSMAAAPVAVERDPARMRPSDAPVVIGDGARLRALGWRPSIPFHRAVRDILEYWRRTP